MIKFTWTTLNENGLLKRSQHCFDKYAVSHGCDDWLLSTFKLNESHLSLLLPDNSVSPGYCLKVALKQSNVNILDIDVYRAYFLNIPSVALFLCRSAPQWASLSGSAFLCFFRFPVVCVCCCPNVG